LLQSAQAAELQYGLKDITVKGKIVDDEDQVKNNDEDCKLMKIRKIEDDDI
jgi:hypothetical protein